MCSLACELPGAACTILSRRHSHCMLAHCAETQSDYAASLRAHAEAMEAHNTACPMSTVLGLFGYAKTGSPSAFVAGIGQQSEVSTKIMRICVSIADLVQPAIVDAFQPCKDDRPLCILSKHAKTTHDWAVQTWGNKADALLRQKGSC